jgi:Glycosyltransferase
VLSKVIIVTQNYSYGGMETNIEVTCKALTKFGHQVYLIASDQSDISRIESYLSGSLLLPNWVPTTGQNVLSAAQGISNYIEHHGIDYAFLHPYQGLLPAGLAVLKSGIPFSVVIHSPLNFDPTLGSIYRLYLVEGLFPAADKVLCVSQEAKTFVDQLAGHKLNNLMVLPNVIDLDQFTAVDWSKGSEFVVVSRIDEYKATGIKEAIRFMESYIHDSQDEKTNLRIVGAGPSEDELKQWVKSQTTIAERVIFHGRSDEINHVLNHARIVFAMGRAALEAMAKNIPVILCGYDGLKGFITDHNVNEIAEYNFSGRNRVNVPFAKLIEFMKDINQEYFLRNWVYERASLDMASNVYENCVQTSRIVTDSEWVVPLEAFLLRMKNKDVFDFAFIDDWYEIFRIAIPHELKLNLYLHTEIQRQIKEKTSIQEQLLMTSQHLHDLSVYKAENERTMNRYLEELKADKANMQNLISEKMEALNGLLEQSYQDINRIESIVLKLQDQALDQVQYHNLGDIIKLTEEHIELQSQYASLKEQFDRLSADNAYLNRQYDHMTGIRHDLVSKVQELSQTKFFKILSLLQKTKHSFLKGNKEQRIQYLKWVRNKLLSRPGPSPLPSVLHELYHILDRPFIPNQGTIDPQNLEQQNEFLSIYNQRSSYYKSFLCKPYEKETEQIVDILKGRQYKAIVVYPAAIKWEPIQRPQQLLRELALKGYLVFFCETATADTPFVIQEYEPNVFIINKEEYLLPFLESRSCIVLCTWLMQMAWADHLPHKILWYDVLDQLEFFSMYDGNMLAKHNEILARADIVSYSAKKLETYVSRRDDAVLLPNAVRLEDFHIVEPRATPDLIKKIRAKYRGIIGYYGAIEHWFDVQLINQLASRNPDLAFVLIGRLGQINEPFKEQNIYLVGEIPYKELPDYARYFDVATIPFIVNDLTNCVSPVKFFEYQALGLPVVSTPIEEMKAYNSEYVQIGTTSEQFEQAIHKCLQVDRALVTEQALQVAKQHTWRSRVTYIEQLLLKHVNHLKVFANSEPTNHVAVMAATFLSFEGDNFYSGGAERYLLDLYQVCQSLGIELTIYQYGNFPWTRRFKGIDVRSLSRGGHAPSVLSMDCILRFNQLFYQQVNRFSSINIYSAFFEAYNLSASPSIGISHGVAWDNPAANYASGTPFWEANRRFIEGAKQCDHMVSVDTNTANWFQTIDYELGKKVQVIPNYVDLNEFSPRPDYRERRDKTVIVYPRRLYEARGLYLVLNILDDILERYPNVEFHFVGKGFEQDTSHVVKKQEKWKGRVKWYWLDPLQMPQAYKDADISLIPTLYSEGTSLSCLEAMASGNAVIATRIGGLTDLIINNYNGLLIDPNEQSLKEAIETLLNDHNKLSLFKERAIDVAKAFSKDSWTDRWKKLIQSFAINAEQGRKKGKLVEIRLEKTPVSEEFGWFVQKLLSEGHLVYVVVRKDKVPKTQWSFGNLQWFNWDDERMDPADLIIVHRGLHGHSNEESYVFNDFTELNRLKI